MATALGGSQSYLAPTDNFVIKGGQAAAWISFGPMKVAAEIAGELWFLHTDLLGGTVT